MYFQADKVLPFCGVQQLEDQLDVDNIVVARNEAELRVNLQLKYPFHYTVAVCSNYRQVKLVNNVQKPKQQAVGLVGSLQM